MPTEKALKTESPNYLDPMNNKNQVDVLIASPLDNPIQLIRPQRKIQGMSAILLPFLADNSVDWDSFQKHLHRTLAAGLVPAVNMDTGYVNLIDEPIRTEVLKRTQQQTQGQEFVAGAFVADQPSSPFNLDQYRREITAIEGAGGVPIVFQSYGLTAGSDDLIVGRYQQLAESCNRFLAFELGSMFAPFGKIYSLQVFADLLQIRQIEGAKHSSLQRLTEWERLRLRDQLRPDFKVLTGNDLAIDMVMYGSDYLLGLSTCCPDLFSLRDHWWSTGDPRFYQLNDWLQYLGHFLFRPPVAAYKHGAAMFLKKRGWIATDLTHPAGLTRPDSDREILGLILDSLNEFLQP